MKSPKNTYILILSCKDRRGIVSQVTHFLDYMHCNIVEATQFTAPDTNTFFMRVAFQIENSHISPLLIEGKFSTFAKRFNLDWKIFDSSKSIPTAIMVSKFDHCLQDILYRWKSGLLPIDIKVIISNHEDSRRFLENHDIPFEYLPILEIGKQKSEDFLLEILEKNSIKLLVLARYMQVLSESFLSKFNGQAINIHHSSLPSFKGAKPYTQAYDRGVKLVGATAHYVSNDLDEGPIIEQDIIRADHAMSVEDLTHIGRDVETIVLARAIKWHAEHRIFLNGPKTVIFK